jgi:hypothetical protein
MNKSIKEWYNKLVEEVSIAFLRQLFGKRTRKIVRSFSKHVQERHKGQHQSDLGKIAEDAYTATIETAITSIPKRLKPHTKTSSRNR